MQKLVKFILLSINRLNNRDIEMKRRMNFVMLFCSVFQNTQQ
jgi:hypothetical protein